MVPTAGHGLGAQVCLPIRHPRALASCGCASLAGAQIAPLKLPHRLAKQAPFHIFTHRYYSRLRHSGELVRSVSFFLAFRKNYFNATKLFFKKIVILFN